MSSISHHTSAESSLLHLPLRSVEVRPRDKYYHHVKVDRPGCLLKWCFYTLRKNIAFGLYFLHPPPQVDESVDDKESFVSTNDKQLKNFPTPTLVHSAIVKQVISQSIDGNLLISYPPGKPGNLSRNNSIVRKNASTSNLLPTNTQPDPTANGATTSLSNSPSLRFNQTHAISIDSSNPGVSDAFNSFSGEEGLGELIEILPIDRYNSSENTIRGQYMVPLAGTYVLAFDNTFSIGTPKQLFFSVKMTDPAGTANSTMSFSGWLLKKKRKLMQGWAKRWFHLDESGLLAYSEHQTGPPRGSMNILNCTVSIVPHRKLFILDSVSDTFHLKAFTDQEFALWLDHIHHFKYDANSNCHMLNGPKIGCLAANHNDPTSHHTNIRELLEAAKVQSNQDIATLRDLALHDNGVQKHLGALEHACQSLDSYYSLLNEYYIHLVADEHAIHQRFRLMPSLQQPFSSLEPGSTFDDAISLASVDDVFYDAQDIVLSEVSDSDDLELTISNLDTMTLEEATLRTSSPDLASKLNAHRTTLPAVAPVMNLSIASILKKTIGKDSSTVSMPILLNEPLNGLQRLCEELEYSHLLDMAAEHGAGTLDRLLYVTVFAISGYSTAVHRADRKPFNPMLGETYEYICEDKGFKFISEKVSHRPLIMACHASAAKWQWWQDQKVKSKFWGRSIEYIPSGGVHVSFSDGDQYSWNKVVSCLRNVMSSNKWIENYGEMTVQNDINGDTAQITFKANSTSFFTSTSNTNEILGTIQSATAGVKPISIFGRWNDAIYRELDPEAKQFQLLWKVNALPPTHLDYYNFSYFAFRLNELDEELKRHLPPTDTRLRPDQRLLEEARVDEAEIEKARIEQLQRESRAKLEETGENWAPRWFQKSANTSLPLAEAYTFNAKYWEARERADWTGLPQLW